MNDAQRRYYMSPQETIAEKDKAIAVLSSDLQDAQHKLDNALTDIEGLSHMRAREKEERDALAKENAALTAQITDLEQTFQLQYQRVQQADRLWRAAHPDKHLIVPDLGDLLEWYQQEIEKAREIERLNGIPAKIRERTFMEDQYNKACEMLNEQHKEIERLKAMNERLSIDSAKAHLQVNEGTP